MQDPVEISSRRPPWLVWLRLAFIFATIAAALIFLANQREEIALAAERSNHGLLAAALLLSFANALFACWSWYVLIWPYRADLAPSDGVRLFFTSQLGKYLPGGIWPFLAAAELGRSAGFERRVTVGSFTLALMIGLGSGALIVAFTLPQTIDLPVFSENAVWLAALPLAAIALPQVRRLIARILKIDVAPGFGNILASMILAAIAWVCAGAQLQLLTCGLSLSTDASTIAAFAGIYAASWIVGFLFMIAPAGFGPREATMIAMLMTVMPLADAMLVALLSRVGMTIADLIGAALAAIVPRALAAR